MRKVRHWCLLLFSSIKENVFPIHNNEEELFNIIVVGDAAAAAIAVKRKKTQICLSI